MSANISAKMVQELRERTSAGMMDCKKALAEAQGDMEKAVDILRKSGIAKAGKKGGRVAAEGKVVICKNDTQAVMVEINSETDFAALNEGFAAFCDVVAETALASPVESVDALAQMTAHGATATIEEVRQALVAKIGENIQVRRFIHTNPNAAAVGTYLHGKRIGVMVELDIDNIDLARDIAMHIAASKPLVVSREHVAADLIAREKEIYLAQAASSGKPQDIVEKMVAGQLKKFLDGVSLLDQAFVKDPDTTVGSLLAKNRAKVLAFYRYEVGEGIEKTTEDFKEAVMSQIQGS